MNNYTQRIYQHFNWVDWDCYSTNELSADELNSKRDKVWSELNAVLMPYLGPGESVQLDVTLLPDPDIHLKYHIIANAQIFSSLKHQRLGIQGNTIGNAAVGVPRNPPPSPPGPPIIDSINLSPTRSAILLRSEISILTNSDNQHTNLHQINAR